ncbi:MAG: DUF6044 family protein [Bacteroidota bacterium]
MTTVVQSKISEKKVWWLCHLVLLAFFLPFLLLGKNSYVPVGDNFESNIIWIQVLMNADAFWTGPTHSITQLMNGVPHALINYQLHVPSIIIAYVGSYWGYVIDIIIMALSGFWGMCFLLKYHFADKFYNDYVIIASVSLLFGLLPFWSFDLSVCGQPFLFYAFLNLMKQQKKQQSFLLIALFPFFSSLVLVGIFDCIVLAGMWLWYAAKNKKVNWSFFTGIALLTIMYVVANYQFFYLFVKGGYVSHRAEMQKVLTKSFGAMLQNFKDVTINLQWHSPALQSVVILPVVVIMFCIFFFKHKNAKQYRLFIALVTGLLLCNIFYTAYYAHYFDGVFGRLFKIFPLQLQRFHFLEPFVWYMAFGLCLVWIAHHIKKGKLIASVLVLAQLLFIFINHPSAKAIAGKFVVKNGPTFNRLTGEGIFKEIDSFIGKPKSEYRVASVAMYPSMAQWNGFYTLDGYMPDYPLAYKHEFREIIAGELKKGSYKGYFDNWGSRCYLYINDVKENLSDYAKGRPYYGKGIENPALNFDKFLQMGGRYIFSSIPITSKRMILLKKFERPDAWYDVYVYEVK